MDKVGGHEKALERVIFRLYSLPWGKGLTIKRMPKSGCPYDLLVGGRVSLEVKTSEGSLLPPIRNWKFNLHRHGILNNQEVDFYILVIPPIELLGFMKFTILVVPKKEVDNTLVLSVTPRTLMLKWGRFFNRWDLIHDKLLDIGVVEC